MQAAQRTPRMPYDWPAQAQYALALGGVAGSLLVRWLLGDVFGEAVPLSLTLGVLLVLLLLVRPGPFLAAAFLGWSGAIYLFVPPQASFAPAGQQAGATVILYTVVLAMAVATAGLSRRIADARERDRRARERDRRALHASERARSEQLERLLDRAPIGVLLIDGDFRIVQVNPIARPVFGEIPGGVIGRDFEEAMHFLWHEEYAAEIVACYRRTLETGEPYETAERARPRADRDEPPYYEWRIDRLPLPDGRNGVVCYFRDISEQVEARVEMAASERRYRMLFNSIDQGFGVVEVLFDEDGEPVDFRILETNPAFAKHTGLVDAVGRTGRALMPDLESTWVEAYGRVATTGEPIRHRRWSASIGRWFEEAAFRVGEPHEHKVAVLFEDVTERKNVEDELREGERRMRLLTDAAPALVAYVDAELRYRFTNRRHQEWFGRSRKRFHGRHMRDVLGEEAFATIRPQAEAALAGELVEFEAELPHRSGGKRFARVHFAPEVRHDGSAAGFYALAYDVTANKRAETALREAGRHKDEFLATLGHELRNPLAAIRMALAVMTASKDDPAKAEQMRAIIDRQSLQFTRLLDDLLDVSRISRGVIELRTRRVNVCEILEDLLHEARLVCEADGLELSVDLPLEPVEVDADPARLGQVVNNLVQNACKFTDPGGTVRVSVEREGEEVFVRVADTGVGLSQEDLDRIFEMFTQVDGPLSGIGGGLGIGLSLARSVIQLHGGTVEARSEGVGKGSEFLVRLPAADTGTTGDVREEPADRGGGRHPETREDAESGEATRKRRVLAADDNEDALYTVAAMLRIKGHEVRTAPNGQKALDQIRSWQPEIALLDIGMPELDGYEVARRIRREPWGRDILLVAMTGWGQDRDKARAMAAGFNVHLTKPVDPAVLAEALAGQRDVQSDAPASAGTNGGESGGGESGPTED